MTRRREFFHSVFLLAVLVAAVRAQTSAPAIAKAVAVSFLDRDAARVAIIDDSLDPYFEKFCTAEMSAKTGAPITGETREAQIEECKKRYQAACLEFSDQERAGIERVTAKIQPPMQKAYPRFAKQAWSFLKVSSTLEGGMPHTRGRHIVIPEQYARLFAAVRDDNIRPQALQLLLHEQVHVVQRLNPRLFDDLYTGNFGFVRAAKIESHVAIEDRRVINPDGPRAEWVYPIRENDATQWIWPRLQLKNPADAKMEIDLLAVDVEKTGESLFKVRLEGDAPVVQPLHEVAEYTRAMGDGFNIYHPNEVAADRLAAMFLRENIQGRPPVAEMDRLREWAVKTFGP